MNKRMVVFRVLMLLTVTLCVLPAMAQKTDRLIYNGDRFFRVRNYDAALENFLQAIDQGAEGADLYYKVGVCYAQQSDINSQLKAISFLENAVAADDTSLPPEVHYYLGKVYHLDNDIADAIREYSAYKSMGNNPNLLKTTERQLLVCESAKVIISDPKNIMIHRFGDNINGPGTEYNPVVSADESVMAFTALKKVSGRESIEEIQITYKKNGSWIDPVPLKHHNSVTGSVGTAGLSADGRQMLIFIAAANGGGNLYTIQQADDEWESPQSVGAPVNSRFLETTASLTPDSKKMYFASNRPGGYGGMDIWMSEKGDNGKWGEPTNLGPKVNSEFDEDAPFIHPDQRTLFFTSNGHNTIGGNDIFKTYLIGGQWVEPENMGYPINTTANDNYFTLTADGSKGYFSSNRQGGSGGQDIYFIDMPKSESNIPLTMVKGRIIGEDEKPVGAQIKVIDNETREKVQYVYDPDPRTGNYLIIFPPGKSYDMIIIADGYLPYTVNIDIPNQQYFYQMFQQIQLTPVKQFDEVVGQGVIVKNAFFDNENTNPNDPRHTREKILVQNDSVDLYDMMDVIIGSSDEVAYDYLLDLIYESDPIDSIDFNEIENDEIEAAETVYFYEENPEDALEMRIIDGDTIYSLPTLHVTEVAEQQKKEREEQGSQARSYDETLLSKTVKVYFGVGKSEVSSNYFGDLDDLLLSVQNIEELGVEITGYASSEGDPEFNRRLSNQRAIGVLNYLNERGLPRRKIVAQGLGATESAGSPEEGRRVEIKIVDISGR